MISWRPWLFLLCALPVPCGGADPRVTVVNMIPASFSGERNHDLEPSIAVNPQNPNQIAAAAMSNNQIDYTDEGPIYISADNGNTWRIEKVLPIAAFSTFTYADATVSFGRRLQNPTLYASMLQSAGSAARPMKVFFLPFPPPLNTSIPMSPFSGWSRTGVDQPFLQATTVSVSGVLKDLIFVGVDDRKKSPLTSQSATIDQYAGPLLYPSKLVDTQPNAAVGGVVRVATAFTDVQQAVFIAFLARRKFNADKTRLLTDVMIVGDTTQGGQVRQFQSLTTAGKHIAQAELPLGTVLLGDDRAGPDLAIAVHPTNRQIIYVAWGDQPVGAPYTLHVRRSIDGGMTWPGSEVIVRQNAKNPALAINSLGVVAFLYQRLNPATGTDRWWETHLERFPANFAVGAQPAVEWTLARFKLGTIAPLIPMLGDYVQMTSVGENFYGIFSAGNLHVVPANFPNDVVVKRKMSGTQLVDSQGTAVPNSLDPFFFRITP